MTDTTKPVNLAETLRLHLLWLRGDPDGRRADLTNADLTNADLTRAYLTRARLTGADLTNADLTNAYLTNADGTEWKAQGRAHAWGGVYVAATVQAEDGQRRLRYGCEGWRTLDEWGRVVADLCQQHEPTCAARYEAEIRALIALCRTLDMEDE